MSSPVTPSNTLSCLFTKIEDQVLKEVNCFIKVLSEVLWLINNCKIEITREIRENEKVLMQQSFESQLAPDCPEPIRAGFHLFDVPGGFEKKLLRKIQSGRIGFGLILIKPSC